MKLTLWILNKHILCFNLTIILIVYQNLKQHFRQKIISGGIHIKKLYKYIPFSVCISCNGFFNLCNFPFYLKHKTCFYSSPKFHYKSVSNWEKLKTKSCFLYKKILQIDYYSCVGKFCEVHKSLFIANITWRKLLVASPKLSLVYQFQLIYILIKIKSCCDEVYLQ